nr:AmNV_68 [Apis mellifera nudivirus]
MAESCQQSNYSYKDALLNNAKSKSSSSTSPPPSDANDIIIVDNIEDDNEVDDDNVACGSSYNIIMNTQPFSTPYLKINSFNNFLFYDVIKYISRIKYLIDIEGFRVGTQFMAKELGILDMDNYSVWSRYFAVGNFSALSARDRRQVIYLTNNVHGLRYEDEHDDEPQSAICEYVKILASHAASENRLIAYKGGHYELDIISNVGYAHCAFNIESLGCPRFEFIANTQKEWLRDGMIHKCLRHINPRGILTPRPSELKSGIRKRILHCPRVELWCFMLWLNWLRFQYNNNHHHNNNSNNNNHLSK